MYAHSDEKTPIPASYTVLTNLDCNLACSYCYEHKNGRVNNTQDISDYLEALYKRDFETSPDAQTNKERKDVALELVGGETLAHPKMLDAVCEKAVALHKKYQVQIPLRIVISTNATLLTEPEQQAFVEKWAPYLSIGISIDGTKEIHDACRVDKQGKGSYDDAVAGWNWLRKHVCPKRIGVKATYCHKTIEHWGEGVINLIELGFSNIAANVIFEELWDADDAIVIFGQMVQVADYLFEHNLEEKVHIFQLNHENLDMRLYKADSGSKDGNHCGACTHMISLGFDRQLYGCQRFATMQKPLPIGRLTEDNKLDITDTTLREEVAKQYTLWPDECRQCPYGQQCPSCSAIPYEQDGSEAFFARKPQCGFTHAMVAARLYFKMKMLEKDAAEKETA